MNLAHNIQRLTKIDAYLGIWHPIKEKNNNLSDERQ